MYFYFYSLINKATIFRFVLIWSWTIHVKTIKIDPFDIFYFRPNEVQLSAKVKDFNRTNEKRRIFYQCNYIWLLLSQWHHYSYLHIF